MGEQGGLWGVKWCGKGWRGARPKCPVEIGMRTNKWIEEEAGDRHIQRGFKGPPKSILSIRRDRKHLPGLCLGFVGSFVGFVLFVLVLLGLFQSKHP